MTFTNKAAGEMRAPRRAAAAQRRARHVGRHLPRPRAPPAAPALAGGRAAGRLPGPRLRRPAAPGQARRRSELELDEQRFPPRQIAWWINAQKDEGRRPQHIQPTGDDSRRDACASVYEAYQERCERAGLVDFAELLLRAHELLRDNAGPARALPRIASGKLLVDEFQDTNTRPVRLVVRLLAGETGHVFVVGDDDQAIYGWRGAKVENVQRFLRDYPGAQTLRLEQNYRSTGEHPQRRQRGHRAQPRSPRQEAVDRRRRRRADRPVRGVQRERRGALRGRTHRQCGARRRRNARFAILYRTNAQSRRSEEALLREQHPVPRLRRAALLRARGNQGRAGVPAPGGQPRRRRRVRARGQHAARAASASARSTKCAAPRARTARSLWEAARASRCQGNALAGARAQCLAGFLRADREARRRSELPAAAAGKDRPRADRSGLRDHYANESKGQLDSRTDNLDELVSVASRFERPTTRSRPRSASWSRSSVTPRSRPAKARRDGRRRRAADDAAQRQGPGVPAGVPGGLEEGLFPAQDGRKNRGRLEEERRLAYVGITRARQKLVLTYAETRRLHGSETYNKVSRFVREVPKGLIQEVRLSNSVSRPFGGGQQQSSSSLFGGSEIPDTGFSLGQTVRHSVFGDGVILNFEGAGAQARVQVNFSEGSKWLMLGYAKLEAI